VRTRARPVKEMRSFRGLGPVQDPLPLQAFDASLRSGALLGEDRSQARHRTASVQDQYGLTMADLVDEGAQVILGLGESGRLHEAKIANSISEIKLEVTGLSRAW
jgi:hypothetical protein